MNARAGPYFLMWHQIGWEFAERRLALRNLLRANPGGFERSLALDLHEALELLEWGKPTPLLQPVKSKSMGLREIKCHLGAICFVEYERGKGVKKIKAQEQAAEAFGVDWETIRSWEKRLREEFSHLEVSRRCTFAYKAGTQYRANPQLMASQEQAYGLSMLEASAQEYKAIKRQKTRKKPKGKYRPQHVAR